MAPAEAIGRPHAADVPTAWVTPAPFRASQGTLSTPPPTPNSAEKVPMAVPAANMAGRPAPLSASLTPLDSNM